MRRELVIVAATACSSPAAVIDAPAPDGPLPSALPMLLSQTGLYSDFANRVVAPGTIAFMPANILWSDAATKDRYLQLPSNAQIDSTDMDHWVFPVGTRLFKQFSLDGVALETRMIWRVADTGDRETDTLFGAYIWADDDSDAVFTPAGAMNVRGTQHDVPSADTCWRCHVGDRGHVLGFSALQLGDVSALPLSSPPPAGTTYAAPNAALGYLHANCGHCHNPNGGAWVDSHMILRLDVADTAQTAGAVVTAVGVPLEHWTGHGYTDRIVAGDPDSSAIPYRMSVRTMQDQMPPLATEVVDTAGVALVRSWIQGL